MRKAECTRQSHDTVHKEDECPCYKAMKAIDAVISEITCDPVIHELVLESTSASIVHTLLLIAYGCLYLCVFIKMKMYSDTRTSGKKYFLDTLGSL